MLLYKKTGPIRVKVVIQVYMHIILNNADIRRSLVVYGAYMTEKAQKMDLDVMKSTPLN